jgi:type II secretory pathway pseudopilin PulG
MKFAITINKPCSRGAQSPRLPGTPAERRGYSGCGGFTLAELLAALMFMAIVVPVAVEALRIAGLAGEVAARKTVAARVAERALNESLVTGNWNQSQQSGSVTEDGVEYRWTLRNERWPQDEMQLLTTEVRFNAQDKEQSVKLSTLVDSQ